MGSNKSISEHYAQSGRDGSGSDSKPIVNVPNGEGTVGKSDHSHVKQQEVDEGVAKDDLVDRKQSRNPRDSA